MKKKKKKKNAQHKWLHPYMPYELSVFLSSWPLKETLSILVRHLQSRELCDLAETRVLAQGGH